VGQSEVISITCVQTLSGESALNFDLSFGLTRDRIRVKNRWPGMAASPKYRRTESQKSSDNSSYHI
jgi:hypothetical protein